MAYPFVARFLRLPIVGEVNKVIKYGPRASPPGPSIKVKPINSTNIVFRETVLVGIPANSRVAQFFELHFL
jgi:hypothetical protein